MTKSTWEVRNADALAEEALQKWNRRAAPKGEGPAPLIHCLTHPLASQLMADAILALGARPMMAEHPREAAEVTETASALVLNLGNVNDARLESMSRSLEVARRHRIPVVLDPVGAAASSLRLERALTFLRGGGIALIKGNASEIEALVEERRTASGVDAAPMDAAVRKEYARRLREKSGAVIWMTGASDLICGAHNTAVSGGSVWMSRLTGTGCLGGAAAAAMLARGAERGMDAETATHFCAALLSYAAQRAERRLLPGEGSGTFRVRLLDELSLFGAQMDLLHAK